MATAEASVERSAPGRLSIGGAWTDAGEGASLETYDPSSGDVLAKRASTSRRRSTPSATTRAGRPSCRAMTIPVRGSAPDHTGREPVGVVGAIIPWNIPHEMAAVHGRELDGCALDLYTAVKSVRVNLEDDR